MCNFDLVIYGDVHASALRAMNNFFRIGYPDENITQVRTKILGLHIDLICDD
jgi:hypothetical protein